MIDAKTFHTRQVRVNGLMMIGISFSVRVATEIISSDSFQSIAGQFSAIKLGIEMVGTSKQPASVNHPVLKNRACPVRDMGKRLTRRHK
jgi:hypothetical protein